MIDVEYTQGDTCRICAKGHAGYMLDRCLGKADMSLHRGGR